LSPAPERIVVVGRPDDPESRAVADEFDGVDWLTVSSTGFVAPIRRAIDAVTSDFLAVIDDDAEPVSPDWLARLFETVNVGDVACAGSQVREASAPQQRVTSRSGRTTWYGRIIGNVGGRLDTVPVDVDSLPEGNWIWRASVLKALTIGEVFDRGDASMYGYDLCLQAKQAGWRVHYTSEAPINHYSAPRGDSQAIHRTDVARLKYSYARNSTYIAFSRLGRRLPLFLLWSTFVGDSGLPGVAVAVRDAFRGQLAIRVLVASYAGRIAGLRFWLTGLYSSPRSSRIPQPPAHVSEGSGL
jgi:GT2 family glycosyltransferase